MWLFRDLRTPRPFTPSPVEILNTIITIPLLPAAKMTSPFFTFSIHVVYVPTFSRFREVYILARIANTFYLFEDIVHSHIVQTVKEDRDGSKRWKKSIRCCAIHVWDQQTIKLR